MFEMKLTNDEKLKVLTMYLGSEAILEYKNSFIDKAIEFEPLLESYISNNFDASKKIVLDIHSLSLFNPDYIKLILKTELSAEDAVTIVTEIGHWTIGVSDRERIGRYWYKAIIFENDPSQINFPPSSVIWLYDFLLSKGYVVPLYFGKNHWANKKTAIDLGLAISK